MSGPSSVKVELPSELQVAGYVQARIKEIQGLEAVINAPRQGNAPHQQLPRHLRRRAVSHHPNRLPRRLRARHIAARDKSGGERGGGKRPSRKYRRRPKRLLEEYNRRQRKAAWLETHIWHAKRFHMATMWGCRVPMFPNDKCFRACYRASAKGCLMQDISYFCCVEVKGSEDLILQYLIKFTNPEVDGGFKSSDKVLWGLAEGRTVLFHPGEYPHGAIGQAQFNWMPKTGNEDNLRTLWIWLHPAFYQEFLDALYAKMGIGNENEFMVKSESEPPPKKKQKKDVNLSKLSTRNVPFERVPVKKSSCGGVTLSLLKGTLNRFRLTGPGTAAVLRGGVKPASIDTFKEEGDSEQKWWESYCREDEGRTKQLEGQGQAWERAVSRLPGAFEAGRVLALIARDPRVILPPKRDGIKDESTEIEDKGDLSDDFPTPSGPIWNPSCRDSSSLDKMSDHDLNQSRSKTLLVPGSQLELGKEESRVPVMAIQRRGLDDGSGFGAGWDLIVPAGWGMPFWMNLTFRGARAGGLRESKHLCSMEMLSHASSSPSTGWPDTKAGIEEAKSDAEQLKTVYFRYPPDKRCNYNKLGVSSPFALPWDALLREHGSNTDSPCYVVRSRSVLENAKKMLRSKQNDSCLNGDRENDNSLLPVTLKLCGKGTIKPGAMISNPNQEDISVFKEKGGKGFACEEPLHQDQNESIRKTHREDHRKKMSSLRKRWKMKKDQLVQIRAEAKLKKVEPDADEVAKMQKQLDKLKSQREDERKRFEQESQKLWLPNNEAGSVTNSCSRAIIGYATEGSFSYRLGGEAGIGFVSSDFVFKHRESFFVSPDKKRGVLMLVRNREEVAHHFAWMAVATS